MTNALITQHPVVLNADSYMADNDWTLDEYIEYIREDEASGDAQKYWAPTNSINAAIAYLEGR